MLFDVYVCFVCLKMVSLVGVYAKEEKRRVRSMGYEVWGMVRLSLVGW